MTSPPRQQKTPEPERSGQPLAAAQLRRRGAALEEALLRSAWEELSEVGYANFTMEGTAARAATSKAVLYRRWPNRAQLALAVLRSKVTPLASQVPNTGSLREDVLRVLRLARSRTQVGGRDLACGLLAEVQDLPSEVFEVLPGVMSTIIGQAVARGEVDSSEVPPLVLNLPAVLLRHEVLFSPTSIPDAFLEKVVDEIFLPLVLGRSKSAS